MRIKGTPDCPHNITNSDAGADAKIKGTPDCPHNITNSDAGADAVDQAVFFLDALREGFFARAGASSAAARISIPTTCPLASKSTSIPGRNSMVRATLPERSSI